MSEITSWTTVAQGLKRTRLILKIFPLSLAPDQFIFKFYEVHGNARVTLTIQRSDTEVFHLNNL